MSDVLNKASLVLIPSGYKEDKIYSVIPTNGDGDLTFTRASDATRVNSAGLIEKVRTNLLTYSEEFDNAAWTKNRSSITANALVNPLNGATTADYIVEDTANGTHEAIQILTVTSGIGYTLSTYAKADTRTKIALILAGIAFSASGGNGQAIFNLSTGAVISAVNGATASITSVGNGWFRCSITKITSNTIGIPVIALVDASDNFSYTGDGTSRAAFFGAQFEVSDFGATDYIPTTSAAVSVGMTANVPRLDYSGGSCPSLLLEKQSTNLATYSEQLDNAAWIKFGSTSVTANTAVSPDGYTNADTINTSGAQVIRQSVTLAASTVYTYSIFVKKTNYDFFGLQSLIDGTGVKSLFNLSTGAVSSQGSGHTANIVSYGNGWYRCVITFNSGSSTSNIFDLTTDGGSTLRSFYCYGAQLEAGSYVSSYIPTLGAAATRVADLALGGDVNIFNSSEGTLFLDFKAFKDDTSFRFIALSDGSVSNRVTITLDSQYRIQSAVSVGGVTQSNIIKQMSSVSLSEGVKIAMTYKNNEFKSFVNGVETTPRNTSGNTFAAGTLRYLRLNQGNLTSNPFYGNINQILVFNTALTNSELASLTGNQNYTINQAYASYGVASESPNCVQP